MGDMAERKIRSILALRGMSVADLAREIGISRQAAHYIVVGKTVRPTSRLAVASVLGVRVEDLWGSGTEDANAPAPV